MPGQFLSLFAAIVFLAGAVGCAGPTVIDDATITARVKAALRKAQGLPATAISVTTHRGEVVLSGSVQNKRIVDRAGRVAWNVDGVLMVFNDLDVARRR
jgi:hyperosmotically inducible periplasmic protein